MDISIVVPAYNEKDNIRKLHSAVQQTMSELSHLEWEVILVDDGSDDGGSEIMEELAKNDPSRTRLISLRRNFGQTAAIAAGVDYSRGDTIVLIDADYQNDPADIPRMLNRIEDGYDVVSGWRKNRKDPFLTRILPSRIANSIISLITGVHLHDYGCTLKAYKREVITNFKLYGEMHRFIPAYANSVGAKMIEVPVQHHPRIHGRTKYGLTRTFKVLLDLFTVKFLISYSNKPIYLFGGAGVFLIVLSSIILSFLIIRRLWLKISVFDSPLFQMSTMFIILGFQSILMGLIAELLVRTYHESQQKPIYTVRQVINPPESAQADK